METSGNGALESIDGLIQSEQNILNFLDSMDNYLMLMDSLSSALRQGWLELASARHSMGASRINSAMFDHKSHRASTVLHTPDGEQDTQFPHFTLCKWVSTANDTEKYPEGAKFEEDELMQNKSSPQPQHSELQDMKDDGIRSPVTDENQAQKERLKLLSMFGTLVSPKLRATQLSFETALETLVEISNMRASLLHAYDQVQKDRKNTK